MSDKGKAAAIPCCFQWCCAIIFIVFFGIYAYQEHDGGQSCYIQNVWSPAIQDYETKETNYVIAGGTNEDIAGRFHKFFVASFYG